MALGLYTAIPGFARWDDSCADLLPVALPVVGALLGFAWYGLAALFGRFMPLLLCAAMVTVTLPILTGFLHLDGFMDVMDAMLSARKREEKLRILKDPHAGAFSVIALVCLLLVETGAVYAVLEAKGIVLLLMLPPLSRSLAAFSLMTLPPLAQSGYGKMNYEAGTRRKRVFCLTCAVLSCGLTFTFGWRHGIACLAAACGFTLACRWAYRALGGMNGDIAGCSICLAEAFGLVILACLR